MPTIRRFPSRRACSLLVLPALIAIVALGFWTSGAAELEKPSAKDRRVTLIVSQFMQSQAARGLDRQAAAQGHVDQAIGSSALAGSTMSAIAIHAPFCYTLGIVTMEIVRAGAQGVKAGALARQIVRQVLTNPLVVALILGFTVLMAVCAVRFLLPREQKGS